MKVLVTGATGFVGKKLARSLVNNRHSVSVLTRDTESARKRLPLTCEFHKWEPEPPASGSCSSTGRTCWGGPPEYIWEALNLLKVKRIDHGVQCLQSEKLVKKLRDSQIPLTVCPLSNIKLRVFNKLEEHNLKKMLSKGLIVMINSDDPAYFGGYINKNLIECQDALNLSMKEVKTLIINSFKSSFLKEEKKNEWVSKFSS